MNKKEKRKSVVSSVGQPGGQEAHKGRNGGGGRGGGGRGRGRDSGADSGSNKVTTDYKPALVITITSCFRARCLARTPANLLGARHRAAGAAEAGGQHSHQRAGGRGAPGESHPSPRYLSLCHYDPDINADPVSL